MKNIAFKYGATPESITKQIETFATESPFKPAVDNQAQKNPQVVADSSSTISEIKSGVNTPTNAKKNLTAQMNKVVNIVPQKNVTASSQISSAPSKNVTLQMNPQKNVQITTPPQKNVSVQKNMNPQMNQPLVHPHLPGVYFVSCEHYCSNINKVTNEMNQQIFMNPALSKNRYPPLQIPNQGVIE